MRSIKCTYWTFCHSFHRDDCYIKWDFANSSSVWLIASLFVGWFTVKRGSLVSTIRPHHLSSKVGYTTARGEMPWPKRKSHRTRYHSGSEKWRDWGSPFLKRESRLISPFPNLLQIKCKALHMRDYRLETDFPKRNMTLWELIASDGLGHGCKVHRIWRFWSNLELFNFFSWKLSEFNFSQVVSKDFFVIFTAKRRVFVTKNQI